MTARATRSAKRLASVAVVAICQCGRPKRLRQQPADGQRVLAGQHVGQAAPGLAADGAGDRRRRMAEHRAGIAEAEIVERVAVDVGDRGALGAVDEDRERRRPVVHPVHRHAAEIACAPLPISPRFWPRLRGSAPPRARATRRSAPDRCRAVPDPLPRTVPPAGCPPSYAQCRWTATRHPLTAQYVPASMTAVRMGLLGEKMRFLAVTGAALSAGFHRLLRRAVSGARSTISGEDSDRGRRHARHGRPDVQFSRRARNSRPNGRRRLAQGQFDGANLTQYWLDERELKLNLYREHQAEKPFRSVEPDDRDKDRRRRGHL